MLRITAAAEAESKLTTRGIAEKLESLNQRQLKIVRNSRSFETSRRKKHLYDFTTVDPVAARKRVAFCSGGFLFFFTLDTHLALSEKQIQYSRAVTVFHRRDQSDSIIHI